MTMIPSLPSSIQFDLFQGKLNNGTLHFSLGVHNVYQHVKNWLKIGILKAKCSVMVHMNGLFTSSESERENDIALLVLSILM